MTEQTQLAVAEQPQQLITIEPAKYVALVFESFRKKFDAYKAEADKVTFDITTAAGMKTAVEWRAKFRDEIRIACENARKERKAPILEIGRLLDGKAKEIAEEVAPYESRFDSAIKAEEARKEAEKQAKAEAERVRVNTIRESIDGIKAYAANAVGRTSVQIAAMVETLEAVEVSLEIYQEFAGECEVAKIATLAKLGEMLSAQIAQEAEAGRLAAERAEFQRQQAEMAEQQRKLREETERLAREQREREEAETRRLKAEREAHEATLRAERERIEAEQWAAREKAETAMRAEREAHERRMAEERAALARQQAEIDSAKAEQERIERERLAAIEAEERSKQEELEAARRAEEQRAAEALEAIENENRRRAAEQFLANGPGDSDIVEVLANHYEVGQTFVVDWLAKFDAASFLTPTEKAA
ncbi:MAG: hypothetical protein PW999_09750 [Paraburkholderia tropica]|nr:hypothetical protein [Paraburkholderia tropica]